VGGLKRTHLLGAFAVVGTITAALVEYAHVWRRGRAPLPAESDNVIEAGREAAVETIEVAVTGYRTGSARENALLNMLLAFSLTFGAARLSTHQIRRRGTWGPFRNVVVGERHIHHFVPGIVLAFLAGGTSIVRRDEDWDKWLALPFGAGAAMVMDESALLLELDDVYWTEEGIVSVQIALTAMALLATGVVGLRVLRRGEERVLGDGPDPEAPLESAS
jgi:hypothetical protein